MLTKQQMKSEALRTMIASADFDKSTDKLLESFLKKAAILDLVVEQTKVDAKDYRECKEAQDIFSKNSIPGDEHIYFYTTEDFITYTLTRIGVSHDSQSLTAPVRLSSYDFFSPMIHNGDILEYKVDDFTIQTETDPAKWGLVYRYDRLLYSRFVRYIKETIPCFYDGPIVFSLDLIERKRSRLTGVVNGERVCFHWAHPIEIQSFHMKHRQTSLTIYREFPERGKFTEPNFDEVLSTCHKDVLDSDEELKQFFIDQAANPYIQPSLTTKVSNLIRRIISSR